METFKSRLYSEGVSKYRISKDLNVPYTTLSRVVADAYIVV